MRLTFGNILHEIMAFIHTKDDVDLAIQKANRIGIITFSQNAIFKETIEKIVNHSELNLFLNPDAKVLTNKISSKKNKNSKPDRVVIKDNVAYLLDYKTGENTTNTKHN